MGGSVRVEVLASGGAMVGYPLAEDDVLLPGMASVPAVVKVGSGSPEIVIVDVEVKWNDVGYAVSDVELVIVLESPVLCVYVWL